MSKGMLYISLLEARRRFIEGKKQYVNSSLNDIHPEAYSDERYIEEKSKKENDNEIVKLIKRKLK